MEIKELPKSLKDITLQQYVEWFDVYGSHLLRQSKKKMEEDEQLLFNTDFYMKHYAFYSNTPLEEVEAAVYTNAEETQVVEITKESSYSQLLLYREMVDIRNVDLVNAVFDFHGCQWKITTPIDIKDPNNLSVGEFERSQDIALIFSDLQDGKMEALYELCAEYLSATIDGHPAWEFKNGRLELMYFLPLSIALCVKRYVEETINLYKTLSNANIINRESTTP